jgi:hypothetical protein
MSASMSTFARRRQLVQALPAFFPEQSDADADQHPIGDSRCFVRTGDGSSGPCVSV